MLSSLRKRLLLYAGIGLCLFVILGGTTLVLSRRGQVKSAKTPDVVIPTIYNGELLLPKVVTESQNNVEKTTLSDRLAVVSANLAAIFENNKLSGIRVIGEVSNGGSRDVTGVSPVVRFYNADGVQVGQKIARPSNGFDFKTVSAADKSVYDVTVDAPPQSEKLEILFNVIASTDSATFKPLLISNRNLETKSTTVNSQGDQGNQEDQGGTESASATPAAVPQPAGQKVDYYIASGQINNPLENPVTDMTIYAWAKNDEGKVFALGRTDFKNDLLNPGEKIDFKVMLLPIRSDQTYTTYEIAAWGREYKILP